MAEKMEKSVVIAAIVLGLVIARPQNKSKYSYKTYPTKYDNIDIDEILKNDRLLKNYGNCLLGKGPCPPDGAELKRLLPEALADDCAKCSEKQRNGSRRVLPFLIQNKTEIYAELEKVFDPEGVYKARYCNQIKEAGINTGDNCD